MYFYIGSISKLIIMLTASLLITACNSIGTRVGDSFKDDDWNTRFTSNCPLPQGDSIQWMTESDQRFMRFSLSDGDKGGCITDKTARHSAPYWERAELKQVGKLKKNKSYVIDARLRFVEGFNGHRENFFQIHAYNNSCKQAYPPITIKFDNTYSDSAVLTLNTLTKNKRHSSYRSDLRIDDVLGKWINIAIKLNMANKRSVTVSVDGKTLFTDLPFWIDSCGIPHIKFGIYRPGDLSGNAKSIVDYDSISVN